jgi:hypothetical protein
MEVKNIWNPIPDNVYKIAWDYARTVMSEDVIHDIGGFKNSKRSTRELQIRDGKICERMVMKILKENGIDITGTPEEYWKPDKYDIKINNFKFDIKCSNRNNPLMQVNANQLDIDNYGYISCSIQYDKVTAYPSKMRINGMIAQEHFKVVSEYIPYNEPIRFYNNVLNNFTKGSYFLEGTSEYMCVFDWATKASENIENGHRATISN